MEVMKIRVRGSFLSPSITWLEVREHTGNRTEASSLYNKPTLRITPLINS